LIKIGSKNNPITLMSTLSPLNNFEGELENKNSVDDVLLEELDDDTPDEGETSSIESDPEAEEDSSEPDEDDVDEMDYDSFDDRDDL